jgi:hypothetical protein
VLDTFPDLALMLMSFLAILSATRHNRHYDALHGKWTQCLISDRDQFRAFFLDFRVTPDQAANWLTDGSSDETILQMLNGSGPFSDHELERAAIIQEARLAASLMWLTPHRPGLRMSATVPTRLVLPARSNHRTKHTHVSQSEIQALTRQFAVNARTAPFQAAPARSLRRRAEKVSINVRN